MGKNTRYVGMDVHAATIAVAVVEGRGMPRSLGEIPNRPEAVRRLIGKLGEPSQLRVCYEAGPTGYVLYWQLTKLGVHCEVVAPSLVPVNGNGLPEAQRFDHREFRDFIQSFLRVPLVCVTVEARRFGKTVPTQRDEVRAQQDLVRSVREVASRCR